MVVLARIDSVKIEFYPDEHLPPHFHARIAEFTAQIEIRTARVLNGSLPHSKLKTIVEWTLAHRVELMDAWSAVEEMRKPEKIHD